jgi:hypothetical protein
MLDGGRGTSRLWVDVGEDCLGDGLLEDKLGEGFGTDVLISPFCGRVAVSAPPTLLLGGRGTASRDGAAFGRFVAFASAVGARYGAPADCAFTTPAPLNCAGRAVAAMVGAPWLTEASKSRLLLANC